MNEILQRLLPYQTDHLILLIGTNPLPNFVAAKLLLCQNGVVHLVCSPDTMLIASQLEKYLEAESLCCKLHPNVKQNKPSSIYDEISKIVVDMQGGIGLHYTGGTKAMSVHAYRAVKKLKPETICSYLDAHELKMIIDGGMADGRDDEVVVRDAVKVSLQQVIGLHDIKLARKPKKDPILIEIAKIIKEIMDQGDHWRNWTICNLRRPDQKSKYKSNSELKKVEIPPFAELSAAFERLGAKEKTLEEWVRVSKAFEPKEMQEFAKWLEGEWLESYVLDCLIQISGECGLHDWGMDFKSSESKFQFDVAAMRGYQLFAISCTTSKDRDLCKSKLFEAYVRAKQMGGDEARVALVCYIEDPQSLLNNFLNEWKYPMASVRVFGAAELHNLPEALQKWIQSDGS